MISVSLSTFSGSGLGFISRVAHSESRSTRRTCLYFSGTWTSLVLSSTGRSTGQASSGCRSVPGESPIGNWVHGQVSRARLLRDHLGAIDAAAQDTALLDPKPIAERDRSAGGAGHIAAFRDLQVSERERAAGRDYDRAVRGSRLRLNCQVSVCRVPRVSGKLRNGLRCPHRLYRNQPRVVGQIEDAV